MEIKPKAFKWKHFQGEVIMCTVRWYANFALSYRDLVMMASERGLSLAHTTTMRWVHEYAPKLKKKINGYKENPKNMGDFKRKIRKLQTGVTPSGLPPPLI